MSTQDDLDRALGELLDFNGARAHLSMAEADAIKGGLDRFESDLDGYGWDKPPALFLMGGTVSAFGLIDHLVLTQVRVPVPSWYPEPGVMLERLASRMDDPLVRRLLLDASTADTNEGARAIGFAFVSEGWLRKPDSDPRMSTNEHPEARADEIRSVYAVDIDERQYSVLRLRHAGRRVADMMTAQAMTREIESADDPLVRWLRDTHTGRWPRVPRALRTMARSIRDPRRRDRCTTL